MDPVETGLRDLVAAIAALPGTDPVERARQAKALINQSATVLSRVRRAAMADALADGRTYDQLAYELGSSAASVNSAVTKHNRWLRTREQRPAGTLLAELDAF